jgi:hypothetical protein
MGAAKRRGTFEQRVAEAKRRNAALTKAIEQGNNLPMQATLRRAGAQRFSTVLVACGLLVRD